MSTVLLAGGGFGGLIQGAYGNYTQASDGTFTVDTRDAPALLTLGMIYVQKTTTQYTTPIAPAAAAIGGVVSSGALSNGTVAVTTQPTIMRPVNVEIGAGTSAITAGSVAVTYIGNDGLSTTDTFSTVLAANGGSTLSTSKGVISISNITVSGLVGGASPFIRLSTTAAISVPLDPSSVDFAILREYDAGATAAVGSLATALGSVFTTTAPNGSAVYSFNYYYVSPNF